MEQFREWYSRALAIETSHICSESEVTIGLSSDNLVIIFFLDPKDLMSVFKFNPSRDIFARSYLWLLPLLCTPQTIFHQLLWNISWTFLSFPFPLLPVCPGSHTHIITAAPGSSVSVAGVRFIIAKYCLIISSPD